MSSCLPQFQLPSKGLRVSPVVIDFSNSSSLLQELEKEQEAEAMKQRAYPKFGPGSVLELTLVTSAPRAFMWHCCAKEQNPFRIKA